MKKITIEEAKERFHQIVEQGATNMAFGFKPNPEDNNIDDEADEYDYDLQKEFRTKLEELIGEYIHTLGHLGVVEGMEDIMSNFPKGDEAPAAPVKPQETDEYLKAYDENMSQGFSPLHESKGSINLNGKTYKISISKKKK